MTSGANCGASEVNADVASHMHMNVATERAVQHCLQLHVDEDAAPILERELRQTLKE